MLKSLNKFQTIILSVTSLLGTVLILFGLWSFLHPKILWTYGVIWILLGTSLLALSIFFLLQPQKLTPQDLVSMGLGQIVAENVIPFQHSFVCVNCERHFGKNPVLRGDEVFCSLSCELKTRQLAQEEKKYLFHRPLSSQDMHKYLELAIQLGKRANDSVQKQILDLPLLQLTRQERGAKAFVKEVISSLLLWGEYKWAKELYQLSPPEPTMTKGRSKGTSNFFAIARKIQWELPKIRCELNPFDILELDEIRRKDLPKWRAKNLTLIEVKALDSIEQAFAWLEMLEKLNLDKEND